MYVFLVIGGVHKHVPTPFPCRTFAYLFHSSRTARPIVLKFGVCFAAELPLLHKVWVGYICACAFVHTSFMSLERLDALC